MNWLIGSLASPSLAEVWAARGRACFWIATQAGYRPATLIAWLALRWRVGPNALTSLSLLCGVAGPLIVLLWSGGRGGEAWVLFASLLGAYWLDCADGMVARVGGSASRFGMIYDKVVDAVVALVTTVALGMAALTAESLLPDALKGLALLAAAAGKTGFSVLSWLKDALVRELDHGTPVTRAGLGGLLKTIVGNLTDDVPWRLGLVLSWATGLFWEFTALYGIVMCLMLAAYLITTWRQLAGAQS